MLFSSPIFFFFFSLYLLPHLLISSRFRLALIIAGSSIFYAYWNPYYLWVPYGLTFVAYGGTLWIESAEAKSRAFRLGIVVSFLLLPLFVFKYANFFYSLLQQALGNDPSVKILHLSLPLGISFITFTLIAYAVDVYRRKFPKESTPGRLLASVFFFPHLIAGPIVRPSNLIPQLARTIRVARIPFTFGIALFTLGLVKKLVFADPIAQQVDPIYAQLPNVSWSDAWFAFYGFTAQIYFDFSGYTDMALGLARMLGMRLPRNFRQPYLATSLVDFWHRWHITLSTWLRDYLYIPLGGNRGSSFKKYRNLFVTMVLGGLWHGANVTFVIWGVIHGAGLIANHLIRQSVGSIRVPKLVSRIFILHFVAIAWVFFRAPNWNGAVSMLGALVPSGPIATTFVRDHLFALCLLAVAIPMHVWDSHAFVRLATRKIPRPLIWIALVFLWILAMTISSGSTAQFIYFEF
jgi:alginate O-acetyltransferase complex protein AlgI